MPTFHVYHADVPNFDYGFSPEAEASVKKFPVGYTKVATVKADHVEDAYAATNSIHRPWIQNPDVTVVDPNIPVRGGCRSTSVGDIISEEDHVPMVVSFVGFELVGE